METKPLLNLGEVMPEGILPPNNVPDLSGKTAFVGQTDTTTLIAPVRVMQAHKAVFILAKTAKAMHRDDIANRTEIPLESVAIVLAKLKQSRVVLSPSWGYYSLAKDFLRQFQFTYGAAKTETLLKMFDEGGIDLSAFEISLNETAPAQPKASMLEKIRAYVGDQKKRMSAISTEIEKLTAEKISIADELAKLGQIAASQTQLEMTL